MTTQKNRVTAFNNYQINVASQTPHLQVRADKPRSTPNLTTDVLLLTVFEMSFSYSVTFLSLF